MSPLSCPGQLKRLSIWTTSLFRPEIHLDPRPSFKPPWMLDRSTESAQINLLHISTSWLGGHTSNWMIFSYSNSTNHTTDGVTGSKWISSALFVHILFEKCLVSNVMQLGNVSFVLLHWLLLQQANYHQSCGLCDQRRPWWVSLNQIFKKKSINIYHLLLAPNFGCNVIHKKYHYDKVWIPRWEFRDKCQMERVFSFCGGTLETW